MNLARNAVVFDCDCRSGGVHSGLSANRAIYGTPDMDEQARILKEISRAVDDGRIRTTATQNLGEITAANLK